MAQQTAVEWLVWELARCGHFQINKQCPITFEQAIKMEKEQIIDAFDIGCQDDDRIGIEYYNETYGEN
jgi:hypothetical protein